jgi:hypothetical protein
MFEPKIVTPFEEKHMGIYLRGEVSHEDVRVARSALRDELRRNRRSKMSTQFSQEDLPNNNSQPKLPGLEDY